MEEINYKAIKLVNDDELKRLFEDQKKYFFSVVKKSSSQERKAKLTKLKTWILSHQELIREALYKDFRKPSAEVDLTDIKPVLWEIEEVLNNLKKWKRPKKVKTKLALIGTKSIIVPEPMGVVLIMAPWNFPFNLTMGPLVSAIAAGNCVFIKPSEFALHTTQLISTLVSELFNQKEVLVCEGDHIMAEQLLKFPFNHIFFTGSPEVGKKVMKAAADHLSSITLELGGLNPAFVEDSADIKDSAQKILFGKFMNAGQSCLAVNYVLVKRELQENLTKALVEECKKMYGNNSGADLAHIINFRHFKRLQKIIEETKKSGGELIWGGYSDEKNLYISPTIFKGVPESAPGLNEEIFGPILSIMPYDDLDKAIDFINQKQKPLALYIFSKSKEVIKKIIMETSAGTTSVNETTLQFIHPYLPFGGVNYSGIGKAHGYAGFLAFSNERSVLRQRVGITTFKLVYPPYTKKVKTMIKLIMKYL